MACLPFVHSIRNWRVPPAPPPTPLRCPPSARRQSRRGGLPEGVSGLRGCSATKASSKPGCSEPDGREYPLTADRRRLARGTACPKPVGQDLVFNASKVASTRLPEHLAMSRRR